MQSISDVVEKILKDKPYLAEALVEGLINVSSLARKVQPEVSLLLDTECGIPAIAMAIKRLDLSIQTRISTKMKAVITNLGDIIVRNDLSSFTYKNSPSLEQRKSELMFSSNLSDDKFCTITQGVFESNFIVAKAMKLEIETKFTNENLISSRHNLTSLSVRLPKENVELPGLYYFFFKQFAWNNINVLEVISTTNEFTVVVEEALLEKAFSTIKNLKNSLL
ncbi:MAG: hypothetical protein ACPG6V_03735 [Flavobacteriales bacterium]